MCDINNQPKLTYKIYTIYRLLYPSTKIRVSKLLLSLCCLDLWYPVFPYLLFFKIIRLVWVLISLVWVLISIFHINFRVKLLISIRRQKMVRFHVDSFWPCITTWSKLTSYFEPLRVVPEEQNQNEFSELILGCPE